jgi:glycosyltransferase involved in cell wall biosynthesis
MRRFAPKASKPLTLTIVIPVYNEQHHIEACLDSIAAQTILPDEVIVVDNNSTDSSVAIAKSYDFVRVVTAHEQGIVHARNTGFNAARSVLIGRLDADTILPADWVEDVLNMYHERQDFALTGGGYFYNVFGPRINGWALGQFAYRMNRMIMGHYIVWGSNMVIPRSLWKQVKTKTCVDNEIHEDLDLAIHLHRMNLPIVYRENLRVGVEMKRVYDCPAEVLRQRMDMWPDTLYAHGLKRAWLGGIGADVLYHGRYYVQATGLLAKTVRALRDQALSDWL